MFLCRQMLLSRHLNFVNVILLVLSATPLATAFLFHYFLYILKYGPIPGLFLRLFSSFSHSNMNFKNENFKNSGWCAWDSNPVRWIVGADETAAALISYLIFVSRTDKVATLPSTVSPARPRPDCSWPVKAEVILSKILIIVFPLLS